MLIERTKKHFWVPSLCTCHPDSCAQLVTESEKDKGRVPWYDLCRLPATDEIHKSRASRAKVSEKNGIHE